MTAANRPTLATRLSAAAFYAGVTLFYCLLVVPLSPMDYLRQTVIGTIINLLIGAPFGEVILPSNWHPSISAELKLFYLNPSFWCGALIGYKRVETPRQTFLGLVPAGLLLIPSFLALFIPGGIWLTFGVVPMLIGLSFPYAVLGAAGGWRLRTRLNRNKLGIFVGLVGMTFLSPINLQAYEIRGHRSIVSRSEGLLRQDFPDQYLEANHFIGSIMDGSEREDFQYLSDTAGLRGVLHFYNPMTARTNKGLDSPGFFGLPNAIDTVAVGQWESAIAAYNRGNKAEAYELLGHVAHLATGDMFQPAHVHDDPHTTYGIKGGDSQTIETRFDLDPDAVPMSGGILSPVAGPLTSEGVRTFGHTTALISYGGSSFDGVLADPATAHDGDLVGSISVGNDSLPVRFVKGDSLALQFDLRRDHFLIVQPNLIYDFTHRTDLALTYEGWTRDQDWWEVPENEEHGQRKFYFDRYDRVFRNGQRLDDYFISQFIPLAIRYTGGLIRAGAQAFDPLPPDVVLRMDNSEQSIIQSGGYVRGGVRVEAVDPVNQAHPVASGVFQMELRTVPGGVLIPSPAPFLQTGEVVSNRTFRNLADGEYQLKIHDGTGNSTPMSLKVATRPPNLALINADGERLNHGSVSENAVVTAFASHNPAPVLSLEFFDGNVLNEKVVAPPDTLDMTARREFAGESWHYVRTCDVASNCVYSLFGVFAKDSTPPPPPPPPPACPGCEQRPNKEPLPPPDDPNNPPPPPPPGPPGPVTPPCRGDACLKVPPAPPPSWVKTPKKSKFCTLFPWICNIAIAWPHDPNALFGPAGSVTPGQLMTYTVEFENEGLGMALETFVRDTLDPALDGATLVVRDMRRVNYLTAAETAAEFPWSYDSRTRTLTVMTGDADSRQGGRFVVEARLKADTAPGTFITNQAIVHFPNSLEVTPTNSIVSAVPYASQLAYEGASSAVYLAAGQFAARLTAGGKPLAEQPVEFSLDGTTWTITTDAFGVASISTAVASLPNLYDLQMRFAGDGLLYTPQEVPVGFVVHKRAVRLDAPTSASRSTETARFVVGLTDEDRTGLSAQAEDPKTIHLELLGDGGAITPLGTALLSGDAASFDIALPRPLKTSWSVRARFDGDQRYAAAISTGFLRLIDQTPPAISIVSPVGGRTYSSSEQIPVQFTAQDSEDPTPPITGVLLSTGGQSTGVQNVPVSNGVATAASSLTPGQWSLFVQATDWAGNQTTELGAVFQVLGVPDVLAPRTTLSVGQPQAGTDPLYITSATMVGLAATDDLTTAGDGIGTGVSRTDYALDGGTSTLFAADFALSAEGAHTIAFFSADFAGNVEAMQMRALFVDIAPPLTRLLIGGLPASTTDVYLTSAEAMSFAAEDSGSGVAASFYEVDGTTSSSVSASTFTLNVGTHSLTFHSLDNLGNAEIPRAVALTVRPKDQTPPTLSLVPPDGSTVIATRPAIVASYADSVSGVNIVSFRLSLDGMDVTTQAVVTASSTAFVPAADISQGTHTATAQIADLAGNLSTATATFLVDSIAPVSVLHVNGLPAGTTSLIIITTDTLSFAATDAGSGVLDTLYALDDSTTSLVFNSTFSLTGGTHTLSFHSQDRAGNLETQKIVTITVLGEDITPPGLALTPPNGSTVTTASPQIAAVYADSGRGADSASLRLSLDGVNITTLAFVTTSSATFVPISALAQGTHTATAFVSDLAGNSASASSSFFIDSRPPVTALLVNDLANGATALTLSVSDSLGFGATDGGVGVLETRYVLDGGAEAIFTSTFSLTAGSHALSFHSLDRAGNAETPRAASITVTSPSSDTTPPLVHLDFPGTTGLGVEQAVGGVVNVRGAVSDASSLTWTLEAAPGTAATSGFTTIASGASNLSGRIAAWNTAPLTGYQTLRLRATDAFGNTASAAASVFVGGPVFNFSIGRKDSNVIVNTIKGPTGIAVRSDGAIWVTSTVNDKIVLISPAGVVLGEAGHAPGQGGEDAGGLSFKTPQGLALDAADNLYAADRDLNRVVKLSPDGQTLLLQLGKTDGKGRMKPGSGPGELRQPFDVAVDGNGDIYVADSGNGRIQVFNATGAFLRQFGPGVLLSTSQVSGIALTTEGLWVSDQEQERIFLFSRAGGLIKSIGDADSVVGEISRMRGLAADRLGALYVVEPNRDRTQKFDPQGRGLLAFGSKAGLSQADKISKLYLTQPIDAAVAPDGSIWITDTGRDRVVRYALPASGFGVAAYSAGGDVYSSGSVEPAKRMVDAKDGAKVERDDGAGVQVPEGALSTNLEITVEKGDENQDKEQKTAKRRELKITAVSEEVQYGPEGTTFRSPVTLTLPYDAALVASQGLKEDDLKIYYWNPTLQDWQAMPSVVDKQGKIVNAQTNHFSAYQVGALGGIGVAAIDDFVLRDGYVFPNPSRNGSAVTFRMQPGSADSVEVRVYDLSGRKVHSSSDFRFRGAVDDGNGKGAQNTYDHVWDVSGIGSGVYNYVMTAKKAGQSDIRKTGKIGIVK